jgi:D-alanyl-D-alanine carboxypeptidase/D-alanyl-D-alanine-endopeptidase (penicillin-binding protein 4)
VTRSSRTAVGPVVVVVLVAVVPAAVLGGLWWWADGRHEPATTPPVATAPDVDADPALSTPMLSLRRLPTAIQRDLAMAEFEDALAPLLAAVEEGSCASVSVDGLAAGSRLADQPVIPASVQKLLVAAVALDVLGDDHRFETTVVGAAPVDGVVDGDLVLVGGGDPLLSGDWYPTSNLERFAPTTITSLDDLADRVVEAGVSEVRGAVLGDASRYDDEWYAPGWGSGVAGLEAGPYDALVANDSRVRGDELRSADPAEAAAREFTRLLEERGVTVDGDPASGTAPDGANELASIRSAELADVIGEMLTTSDNNTAELLVKEIGFAERGSGARTPGLEVIADRLTSWGLDLDGVVLADGSGLSLDNRLRCDVVERILQLAPVDGALQSGLPVAGQDAGAGTLGDAFVGTELEGRLQAKTGTLNNPPFNADPPAVKSLAGYLPVEGGSRIEYALVLNGPTISDQSEYRPVWDLLATALASYPTGPDVEQLGPR